MDEKVFGKDANIPDAAHNETADRLKAEAEYIRDHDPNIEDRILRKCDWHIIPWLFGIWLCAFIDRSNIGNARIDGLTQDLHLTGNKFNIALGKLFGPTKVYQS